jgi:aminoglycoside phosphotransferase (APT) family kinase protein
VSEDSRPWAPDNAITTEAALSLITEQFPAFRGRRIRRLDAGWDNSAFSVAEAWVFRFPRRQVAVELLETEVRVLPRIAPRLPLAVPMPEFVGRPTAAFPWPFCGYPSLRGRTACRYRPTTEQRNANAPDLARFLRALHELDGRELGAPADRLARLDISARVPALLPRVVSLAGLGILGEPGRLVQRLESAVPPPPTASLSLCHGDLYARHLLLDDAGAACGVIDWGDLHHGDVAVDLSFAYSYLPASGRARFFAEYPSVDNRVHDAAELRALNSLIMIVDYGHDVGDRDLVDEGRSGLERLGYISRSIHA